MRYFAPNGLLQLGLLLFAESKGDNGYHGKANWVNATMEKQRSVQQLIGTPTASVSM